MVLLCNVCLLLFVFSGDNYNCSRIFLFIKGPCRFKVTASKSTCTSIAGIVRLTAGITPKYSLHPRFTHHRHRHHHSIHRVLGLPDVEGAGMGKFLRLDSLRETCPPHVVSAPFHQITTSQIVLIAIRPHTVIGSTPPLPES